MKKIIGSYLLIMVVLCIILFAILSHIGNELDKSVTNYKSNIGKKVVLNKDTLMIVDYSFLNDSYILENDKQVNSSLISKIEVK